MTAEEILLRDDGAKILLSNIQYEYIINAMNEFYNQALEDVIELMPEERIHDDSWIVDYVEMWKEEIDKLKK